MTKKFAAAMLLAPALMLAACSGQGEAEGQGTDSQDTSQGQGEGTSEGAADAQGSAPAVEAGPENAKVDSCTLNDQGAPVVEATITNSGDTEATYVASIDIEQNDERVDGVGLIASAVPAGESAQTSETGTKSGLEGEVTCEVTNVEAVAG